MTSHEFPRHLLVEGHQVRHHQERQTQRMPFVDRLGAPLVRRDMDVLLAILWALIASVAICLAYVTLSPAASPHQAATSAPINTPETVAEDGSGKDSAR